MFEKTDVNGPNANPIYKFLKFHSSLNKGKDKDIRIQWNFAKFLVDAEGKVIGYWGP